MKPKVFRIILIFLIIAIVIILGVLILINFNVFSSSSGNKKETISLNQSTLHLKVNEKYQLIATVYPLNVDNSGITYISSNSNIASVDSNGVVTGIKEGVVVIAAISSNGEKVTCLVTVTSNIIDVTSVSLNQSSTSIVVGSTVSLIATVNPTNATNKTITWSSSDTSIATVNSKGVVAGVKAGTVTITATSTNGKNATCIVSVTPKIIDVTSISLNKSTASVVVGSTLSLKATISPTNATNKTVIWSSSNTRVATVSSNGVVTSVKAGTVTITAVSNNGKKATCTVTVKVDDKTRPYIDKTNISDGYSLVSEYNGTTLKYWIESGTRKGGKWYSENVAHIWVKDAYNQLKVANSIYGQVESAEDIIAKEIKNRGYENKALVTTNGSGFSTKDYSPWLYTGHQYSISEWKNTSVTPVIIVDGKIIRNFSTQPLPSPQYSTYGLGKDGWLKQYVFQSGSNYVENNKTVYNKMISDGIKYTFGFTGIIYDSNRNWVWPSSDTDKANRTAICQIDENNFILINTGSVTLNTLAKNMRDNFGCKFAYNLDGGGSRKMYYKLPSSKSAVKLVGGSRQISDMVYFVE